MASKYVLLAQNFVLYILMIQMGYSSYTKMRHAVTPVFKRLMRGLFALSLLVIAGVSSANASLLLHKSLPTTTELLLFQIFIFLLLYVWSVLNPRSLSES